MSFATLIDRRAASDPDGPAVADNTQALTNRELLARVQAAAAQLAELEISAGDVLALKLNNRVEFVVLLFAAWRLGATVTPINPALTGTEIARQLDDSRAKVVVVEDDAGPTPGVRTLKV